MYYWPDMWREVLKHYKTCAVCSLQKQEENLEDNRNLPKPEVPMQVIYVDLMGPTSPVTTNGNRSILTCIDIMTGFTIAAPIGDKKISTVSKAYRSEVYCKFGGSTEMCTDNKLENKNNPLNGLCTQFNIKQIYSPVHSSEVNNRLETWHRFVKACVAKNIRGNATECDEVVPLAAVAYNFFPCRPSKESPFVLMFGWDPASPFVKLLEPAPWYWGDRGSHLKMDLLKKLYLITSGYARNRGF